MRTPKGKPMVYGRILEMLDEETLYSPAGIAQFAEDRGLLQSKEGDREARKKEKLRIRISMGRLSHNHGFPDGGDGQVKTRGQPPYPAWFGWRWKLATYP